ncbi:MAG TPA: ROK family protein [Edaphocola sp.]|nr:ROK family protein [Edaphocola sp.]
MAKKNYAIGIDIGSSFTKLALVDSLGNISNMQSFATTSFNTADDFIQTLILNIQLIINTTDGHVLGVGVGAPNANHFTGEIDHAANLPWHEVIPLKAKLEEMVDVPVKVTNDAKVAAHGEMLFGKAKGMKNFSVITLGTGVGSGIVVNGELLYGHDGMAGEIGHIVAKQNGRPCGCGRKGCLETYASVTGIINTARKIMRANNLPPFESGEELYDAAVSGNPMALEIFNVTGQILGNILAQVHTVISSEAYIFFGGLANAGEFLLVPTRKAFEQNLLFVYKEKMPQIMVSGLQDKNAAVLGAAAMMFGL